MHVNDIMTRNPVCCTRYAALTDVARMMRDRDCGAIPVVEVNNRKLTGIISDRDIIVCTLAQGINPFHLMASDCMTMVVATVRPEDSVEECAKRMQEHKVRRIVVVDGQGTASGRGAGRLGPPRPEADNRPSGARSFAARWGRGIEVSQCRCERNGN